MSTKKKRNAISPLDRLKEALKLDTDIALANFLGKAQGVISGWRIREREKPGKYDIIIETAIKKGINLHWLFTGEGPMHLDPKKEPQYSQEERELVDLYRNVKPDIKTAASAVLRSGATASGVDTHKKTRGAA